jgi:hypothetical protein
MRRPSLLLLAAAAIVAGCGGQQASSAEDFEGAEREVVQTIERLGEAGDEGRTREICGQLLATTVVERLRESDQDCERVVARALDQADTYDLEVTDVRVEGERARARVQAGDDEDNVDVLELVRQDGRWRVASLGG